MTIRQIGIEVELTVIRLATPIVCDFLPYTKDDPLDVDGTLYHKDASMFELAMAPASSGSELDSTYNKALHQAHSMIPQGAGLIPLPCASYTAEELSKDEYASIMGCGASSNLYGIGRMATSYPDNRRYGGMHVNISLEDGQPAVEDILKLDAALGLYSVIHCEQEHKEDAVARRTMYGRSGEYRVKEFGIEYRTPLVSTWPQLKGDKLFSLVSAAFDGPSFDDLVPFAEDIPKAINDCDADLAHRVLTSIYGPRGLVI